MLNIDSGNVRGAAKGFSLGETRHNAELLGCDVSAILILRLSGDRCLLQINRSNDLYGISNEPAFPVVDNSKN